MKVIADNLRALGYAVGSQPASGTWIDLPVQQTASAQKGATQKVPVEADASPSASASASAAPGKGAPVDPVPSTVRTKLKPGEAVLTASLIRALKAWQTHVGMPPTGVLGVGDVMVTGGAVRVGAVQAHSGDPATGPLLSVTSTRKMVTVPVEATEQARSTRATRRSSFCPTPPRHPAPSPPSVRRCSPGTRAGTMTRAPPPA